MPIPTETYEEIFLQYSAAMQWMVGLGIKLNPGRTAHYKKVIEHWKCAYKTATPAEGETILPDFVSSMFEIADFVSIHKAFEKVPVIHLAAIIEKLRKGVNGPINAADETPDSTAARNFLFEAAVAARAHRPEKGIEAILGARSDTGISLDGKKLWVECKRVTAIGRIESNARKASSQLQNLLTSQAGSGHRGIVALDISKILNPGGQIYVAQNDGELLAAVDRMMDKFIGEHSHVWERVYERRHRKIIGTLIRFSFMASSESRNILVYASQWAINPRRNIATSDENIQRSLVASLATVQ